MLGRVLMNDVIRSYENKTVAITGASGYLASALIDALREAPARILCVSRSDFPPISGAESLKADLRSEDCWSKVIAKADIIFHLTGNTSVYRAKKDPADSLNSTVLPITRLMEAAQKEGCRPRVIFASTATVYGITKRFPVVESLVAVPVTNYDLHKLFAERQLELASTLEILDGVSLRLGNVYGPSSSTSSANDRGILNKITKMALQGNDLQLYGEGDYLRDYVYIDDVARAFMVAGVEKKVVGKSFNVASGKGVTVKEAFDLVVKKAEMVNGKRVHIKNVSWPDGADAVEFRNFVADITSFCKATGWHPQVSFDEGVDRMVSFFNNRDAR
jgi:UDP-glucose 4-epimerase